MNDNKKTPCECPIAGFCKRHGVNKSTHLHRLCQNHVGYFNMWEECRGPKQNPNDCNKSSTAPKIEAIISDPIQEQKTPVKLPSTMEMAKNFVKSATKHIQNGMKSVTEEKQQERLKICSECPHITENNSRCGHCGCFLQVKTKWESSSCPIGKW